MRKSVVLSFVSVAGVVAAAVTAAAWFVLGVCLGFRAAVWVSAVCALFSAVAFAVVRPPTLGAFVTVLFARLFGRPLFLSYMRLLDRTGLAFYGSDWDDFTVEGLTKESGVAESELRRFRSFFGGGTPSHSGASVKPQPILYEFLEWWLTAVSRSINDFGCVMLPVPGPNPWLCAYPHDHIGFPHGVFAFLQERTFTGARDARFFIGRVRGLPRVIRVDLRRNLEWAKQNGRMPPVCILERVAEQLENCDADMEAIAAAFDKGADSIKLGAPAKERSLGEIGKVTKDVVSACVEAASFIRREMVPCDLPGDGLWRIDPSGDFYQHMLESNTGLRGISAEDVHNRGLVYIRDLHQRIAAELVAHWGTDPKVASSPGFEAGIELGKLLSMPVHMYSSGDTETVLRDFKTAIDSVRPLLHRAFGKLPDMPLEVVAAVKSCAVLAYAMPGSADGSVPGRFFVTAHPETLCKASVNVIAFHEGIPGHVLERTITAKNPKLTLFSKHIPYLVNSFLEGWALYAEQDLAKELGLYDTNHLARIGAMQMELHRCARLVVDTGIHRMHWSRGQAIEYLIKNVGVSREMAVSEAERYIVMPGQACSYQLGVDVIRGLRRSAESTLGSRFSLAEFHAAVLSEGPLPLYLLEYNVRQWISRHQAV